MYATCGRELDYSTERSECREGHPQPKHLPLYCDISIP
jgi:hypothetical protein